MKQLRLALMFAAYVAAQLIAQPAVAAYPTQAIKIIVPFTPGTGMDIIARVVAERLQARLGQPVVVENKPGASGNIGSEFVSRAAPDGYTLMVTASTLVMSPALYPNAGFDPVADFQPITLAAWGSLALVTPANSPLTSVAQLIAAAKANPGKLNYGSPGVGTPHHLAMELFRSVTGVNITHVPYKGTAQAVTDLIGGQIDVMFLPIHVAMPQVKSGKLAALAVGSPRRHGLAPAVPTLAESGVPGADVDIWYGFLAPKGTPPDVVAALQAALKSILEAPAVRDAFAAQGLDVATSDSAEFQTLIARDAVRWPRLIRQNKISAE